jgi:phage-related protein
VRGLTQLFTQGGFSGDVKDALDKHIGIKEVATKIFIWVERIKNFFSNLGDSFMAAFTPFRPIIDQIVEAFSFLGNELGLTGQSADQNASKWDTFGAAGARVGEILANMVGAVLPVIRWGILLLGGAVEIQRQLWDTFGDSIAGVWGILSGVVRVVAGLLSGNWKMAWDGGVDVVKNAALVMVNVIMGLAGWIAKAVDGIGSMFGKDLGIKGGLDELKKDWEGNIKFGANELKAVVQGEPSPAKGAIEGQAKATGALLAGAGGAGAEAEQHLHSHVSLHVDGEKLAEALSSAKRSAGARGFQHVAPAGGF